MVLHSSCVLCLATLSLGLLVPWVGVGVGVRGQALQCVGRSDGCGCTMDDGSVIDVSSLGGSGGKPKFENVQGEDQYLYSVDPCQAFTQGTCQDAAVCQVSADKSAFYQAGDASSASWSYDGTNAVVFYESDTDTIRQSFVTYICDREADPPTLRALGETDPGSATYYFEVRSKCGCLNGCGGGNTADEGLSPGSILLIVVFVLVFVYLAGGMVFKRTQRQATGAEMVPNIEIWRAVPGLVWAGCGFTFGKLRGGPKKGYDEV
ncbi:hypothetical protein BaRGS_00037498 [Batillaria attramentaria]|uniref:Autophagy-related protein 27 n=1 Tax=Batillaria attramentaria TaxID=370345 RepID=A0ABD0J9U3_9CAEN